VIFRKNKESDELYRIRRHLEKKESRWKDVDTPPSRRYFGKFTLWMSSSSVHGQK